VVMLLWDASDRKKEMLSRRNGARGDKTMGAESDKAKPILTSRVTLTHPYLRFGGDCRRKYDLCHLIRSGLERLTS